MARTSVLAPEHPGSRAPRLSVPRMSLAGALGKQRPPCRGAPDRPSAPPFPVLVAGALRNTRPTREAPGGAGALPFPLRTKDAPCKQHRAHRDASASRAPCPSRSGRRTCASSTAPTETPQRAEPPAFPLRAEDTARPGIAAPTATPRRTGRPALPSPGEGLRERARQSVGGVEACLPRAHRPPLRKVEPVTWLLPPAWAAS